MSFKKISVFILLILAADQLLKIYIKTHLTLGESIEVFSWFKLFFVENEGMAWGTTLSDIFPQLSGRSSKFILTSFRIVAIFGIGYWLYDSIKNKRSTLILMSLALIFAGALGNIIDSVFYGIWFESSLGQTASFASQGNGYDALFYGHVVDMLYLPLWKGFLPDWIPFYGGEYFVFFEPVFNLADFAISTGFLILIIFNRKMLNSY